MMDILAAESYRDEAAAEVASSALLMVRVHVRPVAEHALHIIQVVLLLSRCAAILFGLLILAF